MEGYRATKSLCILISLFDINAYQYLYYLYFVSAGVA